MILDDIAAYLASAGLGLTFGTNLFAGTVKESPDEAVVMFETVGAAPIHTMGRGPGNAVVERPRIQIMSRSMSYQAARQKAENVHRALDGLADTTINGTRYLSILATTSPFSIGLDNTSGRARIVASYDIVKASSTSTST